MRKDKIISEVLGEEATLTPSDLYNTEFKAVMFGGYDKDEVDRFLERVADVFESLITQVRELKGKVEDHRQEMESYREMEQTLRNALTSSQKFSETIVATAKREAEAILEEARVARRRAEAEARQVPMELATEIGRLQEARDRLRDDLAAVLETHLRLLENIPTSDPVHVTVRDESEDQEAPAPVAAHGEPLSPVFPDPSIAPAFVPLEEVEDEEDTEEEEEYILEGELDVTSAPPIVPLEFEDEEGDEEGEETPNDYSRSDEFKEPEDDEDRYR